MRHRKLRADAIAARLKEPTGKQSSGAMSAHDRRASLSLLKAKGAFRDILRKRKNITHRPSYGAAVAGKSRGKTRCECIASTAGEPQYPLEDDAYAGRVW